MAVIVRLYTYADLITAPVAPGSGRYSSDSVGLLNGRYLGRATLEADSAAVVSTTDLSPRNTKLLQIMVAPQGTVHYELFPENYSGSITEATTDSPYISGTALFSFGPGWTISLLEANL